MASKSIEAIELYPDVLPDTSTMSKRWVWKDDSTGLELVSSNVTAGLDRNAIISKNKQNLLSQKNRLNVSTPLMSKVTANAMKATKKQATVSPRASLRMPNSNDDRKSNKAISLLKVKEVAFDQMIQSENIEMLDIFRESIMSSSFDGLLAVLLCYFKAYFEHMHMEQKEKDKSLAPSSSEKVAMENILKYKDSAKKLLAEKYCTLILGLGLQTQHHMECGKQRKSFTRRDRYLYETLYIYCVYVVWICFRREDNMKLHSGRGAKPTPAAVVDATGNVPPTVTSVSSQVDESKQTNKQIIEMELGRLFRSETFNPYGRPNEKNDFKFASDLTGKDIHNISLAPMSLRKNKRPAITSIINQRSPVLVALLPSSQESSAYILDRRKALDVNVVTPDNCCDPLDDVDPTNLKIGIIGEPLSGFNEMLAPFGDEETEHDGEEENKTALGSGI